MQRNHPARLSRLKQRLRLLLSCLLASPVASTSAASEAGPPQVRVCWDYGCRNEAQVRIPEADWRRVVALLRPVAADAAGERARLREAIALLDRAIGRLTPVGNDLGGSSPWAGLPGQQDCIDESLTTESLLRALEAAGLLHWHRVVGRARRAPLLFNVHWTAVIEETATGERFAVDPWHGDQGTPPVIQPLSEWRRGLLPGGTPSPSPKQMQTLRMLQREADAWRE